MNGTSTPMHQLLGVPPSEAQQAQYAAAAENSKSRCGAENSLIGRRGGRISMEISAAPSSTNVHDVAVPERSTSRAGRGFKKPSPRSSTQTLTSREQNRLINHMKKKPGPSHREGYVRFKLARYQSTALVLKVPSSAGTQQLQLHTNKQQHEDILAVSPSMAAEAIIVLHDVLSFSMEVLQYDGWGIHLVRGRAYKNLVGTVILHRPKPGRSSSCDEIIH